MIVWKLRGRIIKTVLCCVLQRLAGKNVSEMTCFVSSGSKALTQSTQSDVCCSYRVDNELLRTCRPSVRRADQHCNDSDAKNDIGALCRHLLKAHGIHRQLKAALYVSINRPLHRGRVQLKPNSITLASSEPAPNQLA